MNLVNRLKALQGIHSVDRFDTEPDVRSQFRISYSHLRIFHKSYHSIIIFAGVLKSAKPVSQIVSITIMTYLT